VDKTSINWLSWQRSLRERNPNARSIVHSSPDAENLAKIGPVDFEIIGLTGIAKKETAAEHTASRACFQLPGGLD